MYNIAYAYSYYMNWQLIFNFALKCLWIYIQKLKMTKLTCCLLSSLWTYIFKLSWFTCIDIVIWYRFFFNCLFKLSLQQQCLSLPCKCIYSGDIFHNLLIFDREVNWAALSREVNQTDALHVLCDWLFAAHVTLSDEHASELNPELTEKV